MALRVLVAEDEVLVAYSLGDLLETEGCEVELAFNGASALDAAQRLGATLDVLVTDLNMPGMSGEDLIRALRVERPCLPIVVLTGSPPPGGLDELRRDGGDHGPMSLLLKPVANAELFRALREATANATRFGCYGQPAPARCAAAPGECPPGATRERPSATCCGQFGFNCSEGGGKAQDAGGGCHPRSPASEASGRAWGTGRSAALEQREGPLGELCRR